MEETINLEEIKQKLYTKLKESDWGDRLKAFMLSSDMNKILEYLYAEMTDGKRFTPPLRDVFKAFVECKYSDLKVIIVGQDPYPYAFVADGIAFSCSNDGKVQTSLRYIHKEIKDTVYPNDSYEYPVDLKCWANQGVLMLNTALTTTINKVGVHYLIWRPFLTYVLDMIAWNNPGMIFVFMGKKAQEFAEGMPDNNYKILVSHPASAAHNKEERWDSKDMWNQINKILEKSNGLKIKW